MVGEVYKRSAGESREKGGGIGEWLGRYIRGVRVRVGREKGRSAGRDPSPIRSTARYFMNLSTLYMDPTGDMLSRCQYCGLALPGVRGEEKG